MKYKLLKVLTCISFALIIMVAFMPAASASDFSVDVSPRELMSPGNVTITVTVSGPGTDIILYRPGGNALDFGTLLGESKTESYTYPVSSLPETLHFRLKDNEGTDISKSIAVSQIVAQRSTDKRMVVDRSQGPEGTKIGFVFFITNKGANSMTGVQVKADGLNSGNAFGGITIKPGETRMITCKHTITKNETITPALQYTYDGQSYSESFGSKKLIVTKGDVSVTIEADNVNPNAGEEVNITVKIQNNSNIYLQKLKLFDHNNVEVSLPGKNLAMGNTVTKTITTTFRESATIQFDITATDSSNVSSGLVYSYASNKLDISVPINFKQEDLKITAEADYTTLPDPGVGAFDILLTNDSFYGLYDVKVYDNTTEQLLSEISHLEKGERFLRVKPDIDGTKDISFRVEATDAAGGLHTADTTAAPIPITVLSDQVEEEAEQEVVEEETTEQEPTDETTEEPVEKSSLLLIGVISVGVLILLTIIAISAIIAAIKKGDGGSNTPDKPHTQAKPQQKPMARPAKVPKSKPKSSAKKRTSNAVPKKRPGAPRGKRPNSNIKIKYRNTDNNRF